MDLCGELGGGGGGRIDGGQGAGIHREGSRRQELCRRKENGWDLEVTELNKLQYKTEWLETRNNKVQELACGLMKILI